MVTRVNPRRLHIWMVTPEMSGLKKTGGLADAVSGLSEALAGLGHRVTVILPKHPGVIERFAKRDEKNAVELADFVVPVGDLPTQTKVYQTALSDQPNESTLNLFFVDTADWSAFSTRQRPYGYNDDAFRYFFFDRAVHELYCKFLQDKKQARFLPDIVHCHDWQTGFTPFLFNYFGPLDTAVRTVYNIHNLGYSTGERNMDPWTFAHKIGVSTNSDPRLFGPDGVEFYGRVEPHKVAMLFADRIVAVSPAYAEELRSGRTDPPADLYASMLNERGGDMSGILNGLPDYFGPTHFFNQGILPADFGPADLHGRWASREQLQNTLGLKSDGRAMIVAWSSRLAHQKGTDIALQALPEIMQANPFIQFVFVADGEDAHIQSLRSLEPSFPGRLAYRKFSEPLEVLALAGSDVGLLTSRFEPCGLNQMKAQKLGCTPLARETGGYKDTVKHGLTGFTFWELSPRVIAEQMRDVWLAYQNKDLWRGMMARELQLDYSWSSRAQDYVDLFLDAISGPPRRWPFAAPQPA